MVNACAPDFYAPGIMSIKSAPESILTRAGWTSRVGVGNAADGTTARSQTVNFALVLEERFVD